ncbi:protein polybromo-1-like isoform X2 [Mytilus californianus]|uniref:protein polybromo-1-like isoform X2 n=1 Tax=Mytilus californianus TaxID=6549 RepID=UPI002247E304|nr:protein polybromo-1-like isoform X2 [Mytilus californianus]
MGAKRKRISAIGEQQSEDREESPGPPAGPSSQTKRRKKSPHYSPTEICQELYETIRNHKTDDSRFLCETFIRAPKRRTAADYYEVVSTPIDLLQIGHKLKTEEYEEIEQLTADMELMITNAKSYYKKTSQEYKDACDLWDLYINTRNDLIAEALGESSKQDPGRRRSLRKVSTMEGDDDDEDEEEKSDDTKILDDQQDDPEDFEALFGSVVTAKDNDRDISTVFQLLPPKSKYPEYYQIIKQPVDLKMIAQNIKHGRYRSLDEVERDLLQMVKNAKTFNEPKSLIYKDACTIKKIVQNKKIELQAKRAQIPLSDRKKKRETKMIIKMTDICADLQYPTDDDVPQVQYDDIDDDEDSMLEQSQLDYDDDSGAETVASEDNESPFWTIFNAVKAFRDANGQTIYEPFVKLPSRRFYPDYYDEIDRPMSLANIRKKIKYKQYRTLEKIATDLNLVFENAKQYNKEESKIHQDAVLLQKVLYDKKKDLDGKDFSVLDDNSVDFEVPCIPKVSRELFEEDSHQSIIKKPGRIPEAEKKRPGRKPNPDVLRKRLMTLYKCVFDYNDNESRPLRFIFMQLPSKKEYPDYYDVITNPIDMSMIEQKIKSNQYPNPDVLLTDFELMFNNARRYNEEGSLVYNDANTLQKALKLKWKNICQTNEARKALSKRIEAKNIPSKLQRLYDAINNFSDVHGRTLSTPFLKLPLKSEYPDYFEIIKKPIDMQRIQQKLLLNQYESVEDMVADFVQMFDNASKYNEPDSLIYKDALTLQRVCLEKKMELTEEGSCEIPDVRHIIQELTTNLFISTYNYQDEEGRCLSDSFSELPERDPDEDLETSKLTEKPLSFDQIKRNIDRGRYRRMDKFQEDMFQVFERARRLCRTDSQLYEDAVEMQHFFIKKRDEICKNGEILLTPALSYTERHLQAALDAERNRKMLQEKEGTEKAKRESEERQLQNTVSSEDFFKYKEQTFHIGDTVYIEPRSGLKRKSTSIYREEGQEPHILCIEKLFVDTAGVQTLYGFWFYRPNETFHSATRKFLEKEVFKSDVYTNIPLTQVIGRCYVMHVKEYFKMKPEGFSDKDVYVCESRYSSRLRGFKKIKIWPVPRNDQVMLIPREVTLVPIRVASVFVDKEKDEADDGDNSVLDKVRLDVRIENIQGEEGLTYFEQLTCKAGSFKIGDCVYARSAKDRPVISRIDKIWSNQVGEPIINSTCFVFPVDIEHSPTRLFYKKEIFLTTTEETLSMNNIEGKCSVLHIKDYYTSRIGDIPEDDVYVCESKYQEPEKTIKKLGKGLKKYTLSPLVTDDELYFFKKPLTLQKINSSQLYGIKTTEPSPLLMKVNEDTNTSFVEQESFIDEDSRSMDTSISSVFESFTPQPEKQQMSSSSKKVVQKNRSGAKPGMRRQISGYIVYSGVIRKQIQHDNPDCSFGDISRIVGTKWRNLSLDEKQMYEGRAKKIAEEQVAKQQEAERAFNESLSQQQQQQQQQQSPWGDLSKMSPSVSRPATPAQGYTNGYHPMTPMQRGATPTNQRFMSPYQQQAFPGMRPMGPGGYSPSPQYAPHPHAQPHANVPPQSVAGPVPLPPPKPPSPVFVSVPPRTQRLLHSEAYLRYIEGLHADKPNVGDWEKNLTATPENTKTDESRMPASWLAQGAGYHGNVSNALWALRDLMLKDTLNITRTVPFESL